MQSTEDITTQTESTPLIPHQNETPILHEGSSSQPSLTCSEKIVSVLCVDSPFSLFCRDGTNREFEDRIANNDKNVVIDRPILAYRADTRGPGIDEDNIFLNGFSVYSAQRLLKKTFCDDWCCCTAQWVCGLPITLFCCLFSYLPGYSGGDLGIGAKVSPGDCFGQNKYNGLYSTGNGALALAKSYWNATPYRGDAKDYWKYIIYMPNGYIDFNAFCNDLVENGKKIFHAPDDEYSRDAAGPIGEILPKGLQKIEGKYVIGAVKYERNNLQMVGGMYLYQSTVVAEIRLNKDFVFYDNLKEHVNSDAINKKSNITDTDKQAFLKSVEDWHKSHQQKYHKNDTPVVQHRMNI